ncbi:MAG: SGNH/GDSL hydrolase family protein [Reyranellales bacterium]
MRRAFYNGVALVAGIVVALGLAEAATRLLAPQKYAAMWFVYGPQGILVNRPSSTARDDINGHTVSYRFNSRHQRNASEPDPRAIRVLVLGDSFTFGAGLSLDDTYVDLLQKQLDSRAGAGTFQLLNAATGGWGTADELAYLEAFGDELKPSAVVVFVSFDDFRRAVDRDIYVLSDDGRNLASVDRSSERNVFKRLLQNNDVYGFFLEHSQFVRLLRQSTRSFGVGLVNTAMTEEPDEEERALEKTMARLLLRRMAAWCQARNMSLIVLTTGWPSIHYPWLQAMMQKEGIDFHDLGDQVAGAMGGDSAAFEIEDDGHPNKRGALLIEKAAWPVLDARLAARVQR